MAENYPSRPITIVVPFPAGGPTDALGRVLADRMRRALNEPVIVENVTGGAGTIGTARVARAVPDGYTTILGHWQTHVVNGATFTLPFDVEWGPTVILRGNNPRDRMSALGQKRTLLRVIGMSVLCH
jgi:tripartite-type tricarboxylate transporter receptor subunit TctC